MNITKIAFGIVAATLFASCGQKNQFKVKGEITNATDKMLYLEANTLNGTIKKDSIKLDKKGQFSLEGTTQELPEFYQLRIENQHINLVADSIESITVNANGNKFATEYSIEGSKQSKVIAEINALNYKLRQQADSILKKEKTANIPQKEFSKQIDSLLSIYKNKINRQYIFPQPGSMSAYYALFLKLGDYMIYNPLSNKKDIRCFAAVATSMDLYHPHALRTKHLRNLALKGMKNIRKPQEKTLDIPQEKIRQLGLIDISLRDYDGNLKKLSDLKGKVVLLDFTAYAAKASINHNLALREIYNKYKRRGFTIYQVSIDENEHFWKTAAANLPWTCVRAPQGKYSPIISTYNVKGIPTFFLINRKSELVARDLEIKNLKKELEKLLK